MMAEFWRLVTIMICLVGFLATGCVLLARGETLFLAVLRAVSVFVGLFVVQKLLGAILVFAVGYKSAPSARAAEAQPDEVRPQRN